MDETICQNDLERDYTKAKPFPYAKQVLDELIELGYYIVIHTARGMCITNGDRSESHNLNWGLTAKWLQQHQIPYHELRFGKPSGWLYVDDKAFKLDGNKKEDWFQLIGLCRYRMNEQRKK